MILLPEKLMTAVFSSFLLWSSHEINCSITIIAKVSSWLFRQYRSRKKSTHHTGIAALAACGLHKFPMGFCLLLKLFLYYILLYEDTSTPRASAGSPMNEAATNIWFCVSIISTWYIIKGDLWCYILVFCIWFLAFMDIYILK